MTGQQSSGNMFSFFRLKRRQIIRRKRKVTTRKLAQMPKEKQEAARSLVHERLKHYAPLIGVRYNRVAIRNQRSRWGSCSAQGNLNFNYRLIHLSPELVDYIIIHELCHLKEMNHSQAFWDLVAQQVPNWRELRKQLKGLRFV